MSRRLPGAGGRAAKARRALDAGRKAWPVVVMAWERWQALPEADKQRYRRQARELAQRSRTAYDRRRSTRRKPWS